jgi:hypothetical protein
MPPLEYKLRAKLGRLSKYLCSQKELTGRRAAQTVYKRFAGFGEFNCDRISVGSMRSTSDYDNQGQISQLRARLHGRKTEADQ